MKPSEKILKEYEKIKSNMDVPIEDLHKCITAIMRYLDEEFEKDCSKSGHSPLENLNSEVFAYKKCSKCNSLIAPGL